MPSASRPPEADGRRVAYVQSSWHESLLEQSRASFLTELAALAIPAARVELFRVPGAFEIPLVARRAMRSGRYDAVVASALVIDGGIYRHEFVAETVLEALMRAQMETDVPLISTVLTPHHFHEHAPHTEFFSRHLAEKGAEAARACVGALAALDEVAAVVSA